MNDKYTKVVYQSDPIGKERIQLILTTLDLEAFKENENLEKIPEKRVCITQEFTKHQINEPNQQLLFQKQCEEFIKKTYDNQIQEMKDYIEELRKIKFAPIEYGGDK